MSKKTETLEIGDWKIQLLPTDSGYYKLGDVFHNGKQIKARNLTLRMDYHDVLKLTIDDIEVAPVGEIE